MMLFWWGELLLDYVSDFRLSVGVDDANDVGMIAFNECPYLVIDHVHPLHRVHL